MLAAGFRLDEDGGDSGRLLMRKGQAGGKAQGSERVGLLPGLQLPFLLWPVLRKPPTNVGQAIGPGACFHSPTPSLLPARGLSCPPVRVSSVPAWKTSGAVTG